MQIEALEGEHGILQRLYAGDESAFAKIYQHYYPFVLAQATSLVHSLELAEDVTQEIFLKIWEHRQKLLDILSFKAYLFITARNYILNVLKKSARSQLLMGEIVRQFNGSRNTTLEQVQDNEYNLFIQRKLRELPTRSKEIFNLCREQSKSYQEVAAELGISRDAVKSRMSHALKILRDSARKEMDLPLILVFIYICALWKR